ncbi:MAG: preprotein translocase subunit SecA [Fibrobacterota bacterium]
MISKLLGMFFGSKHERFIRTIMPAVESANRFFAEYQGLSDEQLKEKTGEFRGRLRQALEGVTDVEEQKRIERETLEALLPEAFATVKDACRRMCGRSWPVVGQAVPWDMVPYDVQLIGGIVLHSGRIAEMATGEGKTLAATLPAYLNGLTGRGVHIVTVNDYLAQRDSEWMGEVYKFLGLTVGCILNNMESDERRRSYACDITYGTNNEFGFDYLRDNMAVDSEDMVQRPFYYAIVDEVDSVLIDEARTPLIISGTVNVTMEKYDQLNPLVKRLFEKQNQLNNTLITEAKKLAEAGSLTAEQEMEVGKRLLQVKLGGPRNKQLQKIFNETGMKRLCDQTENSYMRDKVLHTLEEQNFFNINERNGSADLTENGREALSGAHDEKDLFLLPDLADEIVKIENDASLSDLDRLKKKETLHANHTDRSERIHIISQLLRAYSLFENDVDYMVQEDRVIIIDEHTGRPLEGRRYRDGLHQAIEAKENVRVQRESQTLATITLQNYFRMYQKLAGMTGTAETEENEFWEIYKLEVTVIPSNDKIRRIDQNDVIYKTKREKYKAIIAEIKALYDQGRPVLVGTVSVDVSELLAGMLKRQGVKCNVLNAKQHQREAEIVAGAGQAGAVTIATNMAGRGTDIKLGAGVVVYEGGEGNKAAAKGGLFILGTERHESRRIDRQLRGRAGRQGDPGESRFYLSLEDELMRLFGSDRISRIMDRLGMKEDEPIIHPWITSSVGRAQKRVEARNFEIRKHLLEYDNVMNVMRTEIYKRRKAALTGEAVDEVLKGMIEDCLEELLLQFCGEDTPSHQWDWEGLRRELLSTLALFTEERHDLTLGQLVDFLLDEALKKLDEKKAFLAQIEPTLFERVKRVHILRTIDDAWKDHLHDMDILREGINLQAYGQKDPLIEYKREGFAMFDKMLSRVNKTAVERIFNTSFQVEPQRGGSLINVRYTKNEAPSGPTAAVQGPGIVPGVTGPEGPPPRAPQGPQKPVRAVKTAGPNDPCPCGSGKKYKKCCG